MKHMIAIRTFNYFHMLPARGVTRVVTSQIQIEKKITKMIKVFSADLALVSFRQGDQMS
jgi:hypothetical protein